MTEQEANTVGASVPFLIQADTAAAVALDASIAQFFTDPKEQRRVRYYLNNPVFRPLLELYANGATSLSGARVLKSWEFVELDRYTVRFGDLTGTSIRAVRVTQEGVDELERLVPWRDSDPVFDKILNSITSYVAIDTGPGIVARRELIEFAMDYEDYEILRHLVDLEGLRQLDYLPFDTIISEKYRLDDYKYWGGDDQPRCGAVFVNLTNGPTSSSRKWIA